MTAPSLAEIAAATDALAARLRSRGITSVTLTPELDEALRFIAELRRGWCGGFVQAGEGKQRDMREHKLREAPL